MYLEDHPHYRGVPDRSTLQGFRSELISKIKASAAAPHAWIRTSPHVEMDFDKPRPPPIQVVEDRMPTKEQTFFTQKTVEEILDVPGTTLDDVLRSGTPR